MRTPRIAVMASLAAALVLGTAFVGYWEAGFIGRDGVGRSLASILSSWSVGAILCALTVTIHAFTCKAVFLEYLDHSLSRGKLIIGMLALLIAHAAEIHLFGVGLYSYANLFGETLGGVSEERLLDYLYFSYATYTSLGLGDIYPEGSLRLLVGLEALTGLLMIGWSASMTVVLFRREWFD